MLIINDILIKLSYIASYTSTVDESFVSVVGTQARQNPL